MRFLCLFFLLFAVSTASANRASPPRKVAVRFQDCTLTTSTEKCGVLLIRRNQDPTKTAEKRVYNVWYNPLVERDVQDIWIQEMFLNGTTLLLRDEKNRVWAVGMKFFDVARRKDLEKGGFEKLLKKNR